jgi:glycosyltransferase involved in cell wall biosynthesis
MNVCFLVRSLGIGGAERQVVLLASRLACAGNKVSVVVFYGGGAFEGELRNAHVSIFDLKKRGRWEVFSFAGRVIRIIRLLDPDVVYAFLQGPNVVVSLIKPWLKKTPIVWGIRASDVDLRSCPWHMRLVHLIARPLSRFADLIICNSNAGLMHSAKRGFPLEKMIVIPNGIDVQRFRPNPEAGARVRRLWGIEPERTIIAIVARLDPMKDHMTFLRCAAILTRLHPSLTFVCVGNGPPIYKEQLCEFATSQGLRENLLWVAAENDADAIYNAIDIIVLCSKNGEGFNNVIAEAMAVGVPCVATDVGDIADIVGDAFFIVPPGEPDLLAEKLLTLLGQLESERTSIATRERIASVYAVERMVSKTALALDKLIAKRIEPCRCLPP